MAALEDPAFIVSLTGLVTALTALVKLFLVDRKVADAKATVKDTNAVVKDSRAQIGQVAENTNGTIAELMRQVSELRQHIRAQEDGGYPPKGPQR